MIQPPQTQGSRNLSKGTEAGSQSELGRLGTDRGWEGMGGSGGKGVVLLASGRPLEDFSHVQFFATLWTMALQAPLSMGFSRQEYWSGLLCSPPGDLPHQGMEPASLTSPTLEGRFFPTEPPGKLSDIKYIHSVVQPSPSSPGLVHLPQLKFCPTKPELPITRLLLAPGDHTMTFYLYEFHYSECLIT